MVTTPTPLPLRIKGGFTGPDDPRLPFALRVRAQGWTDERVAAWVDEYNARRRVVAHCPVCVEPDGSPRGLIAEEVQSHALKHLSSTARSAAGTVLLLPVDVQREVLAFLQRMVPAPSRQV